MATKTGTSGFEDLIGTSLDDFLDGRLGTHRLYGLAGNDLLYGGSGADLLDGGVGNDTMSGGGGDDLYRVDSALDVVSELNAGGTDAGGVDTVEASISYTIGQYVEKLALVGTASINGTGNELGNRIKGNDAANVLNGMDGADVISGGGGNDLIIGGLGKDTMDGGAGADTFFFGQPDFGGADRISDFVTTEDKIGINSLDYGLRVGHGIVNGALDPTYFATVSGFNPQGTTAGHGQFLYNSSNFTLLWDQDGSGTAFSGVALTVFSSNVAYASTSFAINDNNNVNVAPVAPETSSFVTKIGVATPAEAIHATDGNSDTLSYALKTGFAPAHGAVTFDQGVGTFTYVPNAGYAGLDTFTIAISDGYGGSTDEAVSVSMQAIPSLPVAHSTATLVHATDTSFGGPQNIGAVDPAGIVWVPAHGSHPDTLFVSDSEVDEPNYNSLYNLFTLNLDGTTQVDPDRINPAGSTFKFNLEGWTKEPTGLAYNPINGYLYISDDDLYKVFWVNPDDPTKLLGEFNVKPAGATDPEDIAINPQNGNIFISNGVPSHTITEVTKDGAFVSSTTVPDVVKDMEALAYDAQHDVFFVGGGFSSSVWVVNRGGTIVDTIDLSAYRNPSNTHLAVKDIAWAPTSDVHDNPANMNLYVADYGLTHLPGDNDGRVVELDLGWHLTA
jgi:hypothetical protein